MMAYPASNSAAGLAKFAITALTRSITLVWIW
jgi:hypothetical protein